MTDIEIRENLKRAIENLMDNEKWLIVNDLNEKSITHRLAFYINDYFKSYDVDCEYNGNVESENGKKRICILKKDLIDQNLLKSVELGLDTEIVDRAVYPDVIIHKRGSNSFNLCIIEAKKSTSNVKRDYDYLKLKAYTTSYYGNDLQYQLGVFILFYTGKQSSYDLVFFKNGEEIDEKQLSI